MLGWVREKLGQAADSARSDEMHRFVTELHEMKDEEVALVVVAATQVRHKISQIYAWDVLDPQTVLMQNRLAHVELANNVREMQKCRHKMAAVGFRVWLYTIESVRVYHLWYLGRPIWNNLIRGFPYVPDVVDTLGGVPGAMDDVEGYQSIPLIFGPDKCMPPSF
jgi:hypothetical protein